MNNFSSFLFIFIGDTHGFVNDFKKQKEIVEQINPEFILMENLQNLKLISEYDYQLLFKRKRISSLVNFKRIRDIIKLSYIKKIKLIGIDFKDFGFNKNLQEIIKRKKSPNTKEKKEIDKILKKREKHHLKMLKKYEGKSNKPIIVILGSWHLRDDSLIIKNINNCKIIFPCDKDGTLLIEPPKNGEVKYCEKIKNEN